MACNKCKCLQTKNDDYNAGITQSELCKKYKMSKAVTSRFLINIKQKELLKLSI